MILEFFILRTILFVSLLSHNSYEFSVCTQPGRDSVNRMGFAELPHPSNCSNEVIQSIVWEYGVGNPSTIPSRLLAEQEPITVCSLKTVEFPY